MLKDIFFLPMIARGLKHSDARSALRQTFQRIRVMGQESQYRHGYRQFLRFMAEVSKWRHRDLSEQSWQQVPEEFCRPGGIDVLVEKEGDVLRLCSFRRLPGTQTVDGVTPGYYRLKSETGLCLWEGMVTQEDVLYARAFPDRPLKVAADTGLSGGRPTRTVNLSKSAVLLRFYAGLEAGFLEIELRGPGPQEQWQANGT